MDSDNTHQFKSIDALKAELNAAGITPNRNLICYRGTSRGQFD